MVIPVYLMAADTIKQMDEYYLTLKVGMYTVTQTKMNQANMDMTSTTRTEIIEANATGVTTKMSTKAKTIMKMKGMSIPPQETTTVMETTYLIGKGILKTKGYTVVNGKKIPVPEQTINISENGAYATVPAKHDTKSYDQKISTMAGDFKCTLYEKSGSKTWIAKDVPLGGLIKLETPQMTMELIEYGTSGSKPAPVPAEKSGGHCGGCEHGH